MSLSARCAPIWSCTNPSSGVSDAEFLDSDTLLADSRRRWDGVMGRRDRLRGAGAGGSGLGRAVPLRAARLTLTGGGERTCSVGPPEEVGRSTKEMGRGSLSRFGEPN